LLGYRGVLKISIFKANLLVKFNKPFKKTGFVAKVADYRMFNLKSLKIVLICLYPEIITLIFINSLYRARYSNNQVNSKERS